MDWNSRIRKAFEASPLAPDVIDELADHARAVYDTARREGLSHEDADRRVADHVVRWQADAPALHRRGHRTSAPIPPSASSGWLTGAAHDLRYACRLLRRQPRHSVLVIITMSIGIAAATVLFSVTYGVLVRPLPWPNAARVVELRETRGGHTPRFGALSNAALFAWREDTATIERIAAWSQRVVTMEGGGGDPERVRLTAASADVFATLGVRPLLGSLFDRQDETASVIVLGDALWRRRFRADPDVMGTSVALDGRPHIIVGVASSDAAFPDRQAQGWVPLPIAPVTGNSLSMFNAIGLLAPGTTPAQAAAEGTARGRFAPDTGMTTQAIFGGTGPIEISATPIADTLTAEVRRPLLMLLAAVGLLLAAATANVASLQLARASARHREMAIRAAIGAGGPRLARQLLTENLLLGLSGGVVGIGLAWLVHRALPALLPPGFPRANDVALDPIVLLFAFGLSLAASVACGVLPAVRMRRLSLVAPLTEGGSAPAGAGMRLKTTRLRLLIMAGQIAITCILLIGASLLGRSFLALIHVDRGYDPSDVVTATLSLPAARYSPERRFGLVDEILARLSAVSRTSAAAFTSELPLTPGGSTAALTLRSPVLDGPTTVQASPRVVSAGYFSVLRMRVVAGRAFDDADGPGSEPVAVVNRAFADRYLGDSPLGATVPMGVGYMTVDSEATVVGVVDDVRYVAAGDTTQPEIYYAYRQLGNRLGVPVATFLVRSDVSDAVASDIRRAIRDADGGLVPDRIATLDSRLDVLVARPRLYAVLLGMFAVFALVIAAVGLFGVLSYTVGQRSRELAVRAALGARPGALMRLVLTQGLGVAGAGLGAGLLISLGLTPLVRALLYDITSYDSVTFVVVPVVVVAVAAAACIGPALRAGRLDPIKELRS